MFPRAIVLNNPSLDEMYYKLVRGGYNDFYLVPLGRDAGLQAAQTFGRYKNGTTPEPQLRWLWFIDDNGL